MKKYFYFLMKSVMIVSLCFAMGCDDDDDDGGSGGGGSNISDPEGTVVVTIANNGKNMYIDAGNPIQAGYITIGTEIFWMSYDNNFRPNKGTIAMVGKVNGLGSITKIPNSGFVWQISAEPGYGYVIQLDNETYARLYVVEWVVSTSGGIIGAKVKYQYPFEP